jgi:CheY-like chemotaxis protein
MPASEETPPGTPPAARSLRVLVAEDNEVNQVLAVRLLAHCGHSAVVVGSGREALEAWETGTFDLILMDLQMPHMNGFEATLAIREREKAKATYTPIVALTANVASADEARCRAVGMDGFISKPVRFDAFCEVIASVFEKDRGAARGGMVSTMSENDSGEAFSVDRALEAVGGERELLHGMIGIFMRQTPRVLADIDSAIDGGDAGALEAAAHKLKGSVAMFAAHAARAAAQRLEDLASAGELAAAPAARLALGEEIARLQSALGAVDTGAA